MNLSNHAGAAVSALICVLLSGCSSPPELPPAQLMFPHAPVRELPPAASRTPPPGRPSIERHPAIARKASQLSFREVVALQALLDRRNLSCGIADGIIGPKTLCAFQAWLQSQHLPGGSEPDETMLELLGGIDTAFTTHTVTEEELSSLVSVPATWPGKASLQRLGFETVLEAVAERYHASQNAIRRLNPDTAWPDPPAGTEIVVPNPHPAARGSAARLVIDLGGKNLRVHDAEDRLIALFPCSIARDRSKRPTGELSIVNCARNPNYTFDPALFSEDPEARAVRSKLIIPPGPNNPVGEAWISLNLPGYGIHGTPHPEDIGKTQSHGCFRLANWNALKLLDMIRIGLPVVVEE